jgi:hypothetical protein
MEQKNYRILLVEELAETGNKKAMLEMARYYIDRKNEELSTEKSKLILRYLLELSEDATISEDDKKFAILLLGIMYYVGRGVEQSYKEAVKWYEKAADKLDSYALCNLGYCYYYGRDLDIDYKKAYSYFAHSAFLENPNAMYKLGDMFYNGYHVNENKNAAFFWYMEAYNHTDKNSYERPNIEYRLGKCFLYGYGIGQNLYTALNLLQAAELGFLKLVQEGDTFAGLTLPDVKRKIDETRTMIYQ